MNHYPPFVAKWSSVYLSHIFPQHCSKQFEASAWNKITKTFVQTVKKEIKIDALCLPFLKLHQIQNSR